LHWCGGRGKRGIHSYGLENAGKLEEDGVIPRVTGNRVGKVRVVDVKRHLSHKKGRRRERGEEKRSFFVQEAARGEKIPPGRKEKTEERRRTAKKETLLDIMKGSPKP